MGKDYFSKLRERYPLLESVTPDIEAAFSLLVGSVRTGGKILVCGNGGSAADAEHIVGELMKGFLLQRPLSQEQKNCLEKAFPGAVTTLGVYLQQAIPAVSLVSGIALPTAFSNDVDAEYCFAQQVLGLGKPGDTLWGLSTSGNSANIIHAFRTAKAFGLKTLGFSGRDGGAMAGLCDVEIRMPAFSTPEIQELHLPVYHALCAALEQELFG